MRPTPDRQNNVWPTGCACHAVRAPGVKVTTEPPRRDGELAVITGSWNTTPVKVSAAPRLVWRSPARTTPALTGMVFLPCVMVSGVYNRPSHEKQRQHTRRHRRLGVSALARQLLSRRPAAIAGAGLCQPASDRDRDQRHLLQFGPSRQLSQMARRDAGRFRLFAEGAAFRHPS